MTTFDRLHPSVRHHVVNTLGWSSLRPHQEQAVEPLLRGDHVLIQAPTAGGKTEAALLPILSRMLQEGWSGLSVVYLCPIKALLNDLQVRIDRLASLFGRTVAVWHGDVGASARRRIQRDPPDILLATPESIEVMLVSRLVEHRRFFASLRTVVVDEVHAFAGDDRGWHLLALLERVDRLATCPAQRVALSATLANPDALLAWLTAGAGAPATVVRGDPPPPADADVQVDYVGSVANAATVIARLHLGEKRLVFCDSRTQVEALAAELRAHRVDTYVSHSSLSRDERLRAEAAFAAGTDCVIVATSTLELGIDVGDLDRVIQVDAPFAVSSFLQRLGRSGRRAGSTRNCLFLATVDASLLRAVALLSLWRAGYVEPVLPPPLPFHVVAQQILALVLQEGSLVAADVPVWLGGFYRTAGVSERDLAQLLAWMLGTGILQDDAGILSVGRQGEERYGAKHFLEIFSFFLSPPLFRVLHGRVELGEVHEDSFRRDADGPVLLSLGGRGWKVRHVDWGRRQAFVEPFDGAGRSRWSGEGRPMGLELCQAIKRVLAGREPGVALSRRATTRLQAVRDELPWVREGVTTVIRPEDREGSKWWTFAGGRYNAAAAKLLGSPSSTFDDLSICYQRTALDDAERARAAADALHADAAAGGVPELTETSVKFITCVPPPLRLRTATARYSPAQEARCVGRQAVESRDGTVSS
ncbi:MAG TPA: DEAD/DEAH box helicase [Longimicrobiaceae bacterium]|nr:DEAD/DEAH box helicase [Longimicrobiaceae bacterium]